MVQAYAAPRPRYCCASNILSCSRAESGQTKLRAIRLRWTDTDELMPARLFALHLWSCVIIAACAKNWMYFDFNN